MEKALKIVTFNVRQPWDYPEDGVNSFIHRAGMVLTKIDEEKADVIAFQEVKPEQKYFFEKYLTDYHVYAHGRNTDLEGEGLAIAFRKDTVEMLTADCFWLSPTPYVPGSRFQNQSDCPRICLSAMVRRKGDSRPFRIYNIHLDHESEDARVTQMKCLLEHIAEDQKKINLPMLLMGDFNALPNSETITYINKYESLSLQEITQEVSATFHGFGKSDPYVKYDYIYTDPDIAKKVKSVATWEDIRNGIYLSDHFPIAITLEF